MASALPVFGLSASEPFFHASDAFDEPIVINEIDAIWWRRTSANQSDSSLQEDHQALADISFKAIIDILPILVDSRKFFSHPEATRAASNKLIQLAAAHSVFDHIPMTTVTNNILEIEKHYKSHSDNIVKPIENAMSQIVFTEKRNFEDFSENTALKCPVILQQRVKAKRHLRINIFGSIVHSYGIISPQIDWRKNLNECKIEEITLDRKLTEQCNLYLKNLGLKMGVFDFIETHDGVPFFIEVNPQGQFLFLQPFSKSNLGNSFCEFLLTD